MLFEERLDLDQCTGLVGAPTQVDTGNERFYEDILNVASATSEEAWKRPPYSLANGLLTPPSTPEKVSIRSRNNSKGSEQATLSFSAPSSVYAAHTTPCSPNNLQVVPDSLPEETVQDILPWLADIETSRSMTSPGLFKDCLTESSPQNTPVSRKSPSMMRHLEAISLHNTSAYQNLVDRAYNLDSNQYTESPERSPYAVYQESPIEGQYTPVTSFQSPLQDTRLNASMPESTLAADCMISPLSPSKPIKRAHYTTGMSTIQPRGIVPSSRVARELFPADFPANGQVQMTPRSGSHNNNIFHHQLSLESYRSSEEGENGSENELSRATHNVLERQRRNDLKMRFHLLRDNIPDVMNNEKAPKIQILKKAYDYVQEMKAQEQRLLADKELERQRKLILLRRLTILRQGFFNY